VLINATLLYGERRKESSPIGGSRLFLDIARRGSTSDIQSGNSDSKSEAGNLI
jgi:hypothetical protein